MPGEVPAVFHARVIVAVADEPFIGGMFPGEVPERIEQARHGPVRGVAEKLAAALRDQGKVAVGIDESRYEHPFPEAPFLAVPPGHESPQFLQGAHGVYPAPADADGVCNGKRIIHGEDPGASYDDIVIREHGAILKGHGWTAAWWRISYCSMPPPLLFPQQAQRGHGGDGQRTADHEDLTRGPAEDPGEDIQDWRPCGKESMAGACAELHPELC